MKENSEETFRAVEIAAQYGAQLSRARRLRADEKNQYAEWARDYIMIGINTPGRCKVDRSAVRQVIGDRVSDGQFLGCENSAWIISEAEWNQIVVLSAQIAAKKEENHKKAAAREEDDIRNKIASGYCFSCRSYCDGDCGHYSSNPHVQFSRDLNDAVRESNYGIDD